MVKGLFAGLALVLSSSALAQWQIDNEHSRLSFVSVKKDVIGEVHKFKQLKGSLSDSGQLNIEIPLSSVETMIPIRNERMQKMLFNTKLFPSAHLTAKVPAEYFNLKDNASKVVTVQADLGLHGVNKLLDVEVMITKVSDNKLLVTSFKPVVISPADFGLDKGIMQLQAVAKLPSITQSVPVSFVLTFTQ